MKHQVITKRLSQLQNTKLTSIIRHFQIFQQTSAFHWKKINCCQLTLWWILRASTVTFTQHITCQHFLSLALYPTHGPLELIEVWLLNDMWCLYQDGCFLLTTVMIGKLNVSRERVQEESVTIYYYYYYYYSYYYYYYYYMMK